MLKDYQAMIIDERTALSRKVHAMEGFINGRNFALVDAVDQKRMNMQLCAMKLYRNILEERIAAFNG